jgi:hypothetical protein
VLWPLPRFSGTQGQSDLRLSFAPTADCRFHLLAYHQFQVGLNFLMLRDSLIIKPTWCQLRHYWTVNRHTNGIICPGFLLDIYKDSCLGIIGIVIKVMVPCMEVFAEQNIPHATLISTLAGSIGHMLPAQWRSVMPIADNNYQLLSCGSKSITKLVIRAKGVGSVRTHATSYSTICTRVALDDNP